MTDTTLHQSFSGAASSIIEGGRVYSYLRVLHYYLLLKSIVFMLCKQKYMNICPPPPQLLSGGATAELAEQRSYQIMLDRSLYYLHMEVYLFW
jgi:hypothetical protein